LNLLFVILGCIFLLILGFFVRVKLIWRNRHRGWDAYYYLLCAEEFRKNKRIPIVLPPYYLLESQEQWYPPGFTILVSLLPEEFLKKHYWAVAPAVDCLILALLYILTYLITGNIIVAVLASFLYSLTPIVISECSSLNSRPLGSLLLAATMVSLFKFTDSYSPYFLISCLVTGFFLLMTHKMSYQSLFFVLPMMSLIFWNPGYILIVLGIIVTTLLFSKGFFVKILKGQYDIMSFWNRNWKYIGAHQIYDSPIYGRESQGNPERLYQSGFKGLLKLIKRLGGNVFIIMLIFPLIFYPKLSLFDKQMLWWVILTYALAALTLFIPRFRFYGEGFKYLRLAAFPVCYLSILPIHYGWNVDYYFYPLLGIATLLSLRSIVRSYRAFVLARGVPSLEDDSLSKVINFLRENSEVKAIACISCGLCDIIAYSCRKRVLWGTHTYGFKNVEPLFPVWRQPIASAVRKYEISHLLVNTDYVSPEVLKLSPDNMVFHTKQYQVYRVEE